MADAINTSTIVNRSDTTNNSTKSSDTLRPYYYTVFQTHCCDTKAAATTTTTTQLKDTLPISKKIRAEAEEQLNRIHGALIERLEEIITYTSVVPSVYFDNDDNFHIFRYLIDRVMFKTMNDASIINWNSSLKELYPIRTSGNGNCLLHAVLIAMVGIHDSNLYLRDRLAQFMDENKDLLKNHWRIERLKSDKSYGIRSEDFKLNNEWDELCSIVHYDKPEDGQTTIYLEFLEAVHIFSIANMIRRPIIVLSEDVIRNKNGEAISVNDLFGIYLPILLAPSDCIHEPIVLVYDHSHFCPLITSDSHKDKLKQNLLPLYQSINHTYDQSLLPIRFLGDDTSSERSLNLLREYLRIQKIKYNYDTKSSPLSIFCAELGSKQLSMRYNFFILYHKYLTDFFEVQKPKVIEEERNRDKQYELDNNNVSRQMKNDSSGWSLLRPDHVSTSLPSVTSQRSNSTLNNDKMYSQKYDTSDSRYTLHSPLNDEPYVPSNGAIHFEKSSIQPNKSVRLPDYARVLERDLNGTYTHSSPVKQASSTNYPDNINNVKSNDKSINNLNINLPKNDSKASRDQQRIEIPVQHIPSKSLANQHTSTVSDRDQDVMYLCFNCQQAFQTDRASSYCPKCESRMQQQTRYENVPISRPQSRTQLTNMYPPSYSIAPPPAPPPAPAPKQSNNRKNCPRCGYLNILANLSNPLSHYCSACRHDLFSSYPNY
ncbi:unnamed protein product [Adineta steineri]|uniref:OTU domain-containing protein n=2 Tax=Adineta steineri TaxID=433720 RepID=A0A818M1Y9_9BILA|nr:unnamed protein product [Adineta steineri]